MIRSARAWRVLNIEIGLDEPESALRSRADSAVGIDSEQVRGLRIALRLSMFAASERDVAYASSFTLTWSSTRHFTVSSLTVRCTLGRLLRLRKSEPAWL